MKWILFPGGELHFTAHFLTVFDNTLTLLKRNSFMITLVDRQGWQRSCKLCWFDVSSALVLIMREPKNNNIFLQLDFYSSCTQHSSLFFHTPN